MDKPRYLLDDVVDTCCGLRIGNVDSNTRDDVKERLSRGLE